MTEINLPYRPCVGIVLVNGHGQIFTGERIDTPGAWQMPQGGIDKGESPDFAALRELQEEIGVDPSQVSVISKTQTPLRYDLPAHLVGKVWGGRYAGQEQIWYLMKLDAPDSAITIETDNPEFARWRWSSIQETLDNIVPFKRDIYKTVLETFFK